MERRLTAKETAEVAALIVLAAVVMLIFGCAFMTALSLGVAWLIEDAWPAVERWAQEKPRVGDVVASAGLVLVLVIWWLRERRRVQ